MDRKTVLEEFVKREPEDPFPRYGLAMAYREEGDFGAAQIHFEVLLERFPDYLATYLMAGNNLVSLGRSGDAGAVYQRGIDVTTAGGDTHTRSELEAALAELDGSE